MIDGGHIISRKIYHPKNDHMYHHLMTLNWNRKCNSLLPVFIKKKKKTRYYLLCLYRLADY